MKTRSILHTAALLCCLLLAAQPAAPAPEKEHSEEAVNSIVLEDRTEVVCRSKTKSTAHYRTSVTVLNSSGLDAAQFYCWCDDFQSLQKFEGKITDQQGNPVRTLKKSDLQKSEYSSSLMTDSYFYYYECLSPTFPITVTYEWTIRVNEGLINYPSFMPQTHRKQRVENASYRIELPPGQDCRYYALHADRLRISESRLPNGGQVVEVSAQSLPPLESEPYDLPLHQTMPVVYFAPSDFRYAGTEGNMATWQDFGRWQYALLQGRDGLDEAFCQQLHALTDTCSTDRQRVRLLYDYLAANTRYVSIQLGIGGWQPIAAEEVHRTGFGDCKGLSNFMAAMLREVGVESVYTIISTRNERLLTDYASISQMNHAILQVPLPGDTLWLECTNPDLPFGYVHSNIAGHDALLILPDGGQLCRLPSYPDSLNTQHTTAHIRLDATGKAEATVEEVSRLFQYESRRALLHASPDKQVDMLRNGLSLTNAQVYGLSSEEHKESHPELSLHYRVSTPRYGRKTGSRLFVPLNIFRSDLYTALQAPPDGRNTPVYIGYGYQDTEEITLTIPEGYTVESLPEDCEATTEAGRFSSTITVEGNTIRIRQQLDMHKGTYPPESYGDFCSFMSQVVKQYAATVVLRRQ